MRVVLVTGSRDWADEAAVRGALNELEPDVVIVGDCPSGADLHARNWCMESGSRLRVFAAHWTRLGRYAGPERNGRMVRALANCRNDGDECHAVAFPLPGGKGTQGCMLELRAAEFDVDDRGRA